MPSAFLEYKLLFFAASLLRRKHFIGSKNGNFVILTTELNTNELLQHLNPDI
jgi:hypothetical protein